MSNVDSVIAKAVVQLTGLTTGDRGHYDLGAIARVMWAHDPDARLGFFGASEYIHFRNGDMGRGRYADGADVVSLLDGAPRLAVWGNGAIEIMQTPDAPMAVPVQVTWIALPRATQRLLAVIASELDRQDLAV